MADERPECCETCRFWDPTPAYGLCRRNPPVTALASVGAVVPTTRWPLTHADDWCGEWRAKDAPPAGSDD